MQVLVAGAAGLLGEAIVAELRSCGYSVRAMVRSGRKAVHLHRYGATLEFGNLEDPRSLGRACSGAQALVIALPARPPAGQRGEHFSGAGARLLMAAARQAEMQQIVFISALKADQAPRVPELVQRHMSEAYLRGCGLPFTIVRPAALQEWFGERYPLKALIERLHLGPLPGRGRGQHSFVAADEVARVARLALELPELRDTVVEVGGPQQFSFVEAYRRIASITGRRIVPLALGEPVVQAANMLAHPLLPDLAGLRGMGAFFDRSGYTCTTSPLLAEALGTRRSFDEYIATIYTPHTPRQHDAAHAEPWSAESADGAESVVQPHGNH